MAKGLQILDSWPRIILPFTGLNLAGGWQRSCFSKHQILCFYKKSNFLDVNLNPSSLVLLRDNKQSDMFIFPCIWTVGFLKRGEIILRQFYTIFYSTLRENINNELYKNYAEKVAIPQNFCSLKVEAFTKFCYSQIWSTVIFTMDTVNFQLVWQENTFLMPQWIECEKPNF